MVFHQQRIYPVLLFKLKPDCAGSTNDASVVSSEDDAWSNPSNHSIASSTAIYPRVVPLTPPPEPVTPQHRRAQVPPRTPVVNRTNTALSPPPPYRRTGDDFHSAVETPTRPTRSGRGPRQPIRDHTSGDEHPSTFRAQIGPTARPSPADYSSTSNPVSISVLPQPTPILSKDARYRVPFKDEIVNARPSSKLMVSVAPIPLHWANFVGCTRSG